MATTRQFFGITDRLTDNPWSRNGWGAKGSTPDLYQTKEAAQRQIDRGKISVMMKFWDYDPVIVTYDLTLVTYTGISL